MSSREAPISQEAVRHILVWAESLSWGIIPTTHQRPPFEQRWPGVMESCPASPGQERIIKNWLNGRRTAWDDPFKPGRDRRIGLARRIEIHLPLALVILLLGTNDVQSTRRRYAWHSTGRSHW